MPRSVHRLRRTSSVTLISLILLVMLVPGVKAWEQERPSFDHDINERVESSKSNGVAAVGLGVNITKYMEADKDYDGDGDADDSIRLHVAATANTREVITYNFYTPSYQWYDVDDPTYITGDDAGAWIYLQSGNPVRFYGGRRSAEYEKIWVCSNGFISFDHESTSPYNFLGIPHSQSPNTIIAPFWRDLILPEGSDAKITKGIVSTGSYYLYVITWKNVRNKINNEPQTFQVAIEFAPDYQNFYHQSRIWFSYKSVTLDDFTTIGIENQRGLEGISYDYQSLGNEMTLMLRQTSNSAYIQYLKIKLNRGNDAYALIDINEDPDWVRGYNIKLESTEPDPAARFLGALAGESTLLLISAALGPKGGLIFSGVVITLELVYLAAELLSPARDLEIQDDIPTPHSLSYIEVESLENWELSGFTVVDAALSIEAYWAFTDDNNNQDHELTITSELTYANFNLAGDLVDYNTISTDLSLKAIRDAGDDTSTARVIGFPADVSGFLASNDQVDMYKFQVDGGKKLDIRMNPPSDCDFDLELLNSTGDPVGWSRKRETGAAERIAYQTGGSPAYSYVYYVKVIWVVFDPPQGYGRYTLDLDEYTSGGGSGGPPPLFDMI